MTCAPIRTLMLACLALAASSDVSGAQRRRARDEDLQSIQVNGRERTYMVRAPRDRSGLLPVVIVLHGGGGNARNAEVMSGFTRLVERERLIAVYPNGSGRLGDRLLTWNAGHCCGYAMDQRVDDIAFIDAMLDALARDYPMDVQRIYITGMSNGAMMTHRLAAELRHRPAAIAPVVGAVFGDEPAPISAVSAIIFNGLKDRAVPAAGGLGAGVGRRAWDGVPPSPNEAQGEYWRRAGGCDATSRVIDGSRVITRTWACPDGRAVELHQIKDGGHAWPGGRAGRARADAPSTAMDATTVMWEFFKGKRASG
jgi:polyhydroxybutyrate depolymerase